MLPLAVRAFMYYDEKNEQQGPVLGVELKLLFTRGGGITKDTYVWTEGMEEWQRLEDVKALYEFVLDHDDDEEEEEKRARKRNQDLQETQKELENDEGTASHAKANNKRKGNEMKEGYVYVQGLPLDTDEEEVQKFFAKCGLIQTDIRTQKPMVKLYRDNETGKLKGDCSVCYCLDASVELALKILDGTPFRLDDPNTIVKVERRKKRKGAGEATKKLKGADAGTSSAVDKNQDKAWKNAVKMRKLQQQQALSWNEEGMADTKGLTIIVLKHMFTEEDTKQPSFLEDLREDIMEECSKDGEVKKITIFDKHPQGVVIVKFASPRSAELCIERMNGRWYAKHQIQAEFWDMVTDYRPQSSEEEEKKRLEWFGEWLEKQ